MKPFLIIALTLTVIAVIGVTAYDAMQAKPEREILVEENYVPPERAQVPTPQVSSDVDLTPMP